MRQENEKYTLSIKITSIESNLLGSKKSEKTTITNDTTVIRASIAKIGTRPPKRTRGQRKDDSVYQYIE